MSWIWKDKPQKKTKLNFTAETRQPQLEKRVIKLHLEVDMEYPYATDIVKTIRETKTSFVLPEHVQMLDARLSHVEILGEPDVRL